MRIALVSHSLIHPRQYLWAEELRKQGQEVLEVFPLKWRSLTREGGFQVHSEGNMYLYVFGHEAVREIEGFKPDWIYVQNEPNSLVAYQMLSLARRLRCRLACFTWENLEKSNLFPFQQDVLHSCDLMVCGNKGARQIMTKRRVNSEKLIVMPQVGVETSFFKPMNSPKEFPVLFVGRMAPEKGVKLIRQAYPETKFVTNVPYTELPEIYNKARVSVQFSYSTPRWAEQFNYGIAESLSCGVPVVSSDCGAIPEVYGKSYAVRIVREKDVKGLKIAIEGLLSRADLSDLGRCGRAFVVKNLSNEAIAKKLISEFEKR